MLTTALILSGARKVFFRDEWRTGCTSTSLNSRHCEISCRTPISTPKARFPISVQNSGPQNGSSWTAVPNARSQNANVGRLWPARIKVDPCRYSDTRHPTATIRINGSEWRICRTTQAGHPRVRHHSYSSAIRLWSHVYALRASPRKASSSSVDERPDRAREATRDAWLWISRSGRRSA